MYAVGCMLRIYVMLEEGKDWEYTLSHSCAAPQWMLQEQDGRDQ